MSPRKGEPDLDKFFSSLKKDARNIDLSNKGLTEIPYVLYSFPLVQNIYLCDNHIDELPEDFFEHFPCLRWLDLRNNDLVELPPSIGEHKKLKNLLLEKNNIEQLPRELGRTSLTGLSLNGNPLIFPPAEVIELGVKAILNYLLNDGMGEDEYSDNDSQDDEELNNLGYRRMDRTLYSNANLSKELNEFKNSEAVHNIYSTDNLENHGPLPIAVSLHHPPLFAKEKSRNLSFGKDNQTVEYKENKNKIKDWEYLKNERKKNKQVLDEWRQDARRLQQSLLPRSKTDIPIMPPYGIDKNESLRPITSEERTVHSNVHEETVNKVMPQSKNEKIVKAQYESQAKELAKHKKVKPKKSMANMKQLLQMEYENKPTKKPTIKGESGDQDIFSKNSVEALVQKSQNLREKLDNEVQTRMRQYSSQLKFRNQKKSNESQSRELQRQLLDRKMDRDPQLEYRFKAFTGDTSSAYSSSNKTTSM